MDKLADKTILVAGPADQIAFPPAERLTARQPAILSAERSEEEGHDTWEDSKARLR